MSADPATIDLITADAPAIPKPLPVGFDQLTTAATLGLDQRPWTVAAPLAAPEHLDALDRNDAAAGLLGAAALADAAQRAGLIPRRVTVPAPPPLDPDEWPEWHPAASLALLPVLYRSATVLADLLRHAAAAGFRVPAPLLPILLDGAARHPGVGRAVLGVIGSPGRRLLRQDPAWAGLAIVSAVDLSVPVGWLTGTRDERRAHLTALRRTDPTAARELLAAGWPTETAADRQLWLEVLRMGLGADDEEFLEGALDDRSGPVRIAAADLLGRLPASAFVGRAIVRALPLLDHLNGQLVTAEAAPSTPADRRDAPAPHPAGWAPTVWRWHALMAAVPPTVWADRFGLDPLAAATVPVAGPYAAELHRSWRSAVVRFGSADTSPGGTGTWAGTWARALLIAPHDAVRSTPSADTSDAELAAVWAGADPAAVPSLVTTLIADGAPGTVVTAMLAAVPGPWPIELAADLPRWLGARLRSGLHTSGDFYDLLARRLPTSGTAVWRSLLDGLDGNSPVPRAAARALDTVLELVALRHRFLEELR